MYAHQFGVDLVYLHKLNIDVLNRDLAKNGLLWY